MARMAEQLKSGITQNKIAPPAQIDLASRVFVGLAGVFFFLAILKFGDPVLLQNALVPPDNFQEAVFESWQVKWGYILLAPLIVAGLFAFRWRKFNGLAILPAVWLGWQFISATRSVSPQLSSLALEHFSACVILFYLGCYALGPVKNPWPLWTALALALCWIIHAGFDQHFGGLEATRRLFFSTKDHPELPPGVLTDAYLRRIASNRIFSTFSNPDALAGAIELLLPISVLFLWQITPKVRTAMRWVFVAVLGGCGLACMYWTGSKAGWLVTVIMIIFAVAASTLARKWKGMIVVTAFFLGLIAFGIHYSADKKKQEVSVGTRITYWKAALRITAQHPILGTGPGTFSIPYAEMKRPEDDFARLCHNDYLEQACDSGMPGFLAYSALIIGGLFSLYRYRFYKNLRIDSAVFVVWLGVTGFCLHSVVDYPLYTPALSWPMFFLLGWLMYFKD